GFSCSEASRSSTGRQSTMSPRIRPLGSAPYSKVSTLVAASRPRQAAFSARPSSASTMRRVRATGLPARGSGGARAKASARPTQRRRRQRGSAAASTAYWTERVKSGYMVARPLIGFDDPPHQRVAHHVAAGEAGLGDARYVVEHVQGVQQAALVALGQIHLGRIAVDDGLAAETDPGQEHFHLFRRGVLGLVEDDEGVVQRAAAHVGQRGDLDGLLLEQALRALE